VVQYLMGLNKRFMGLNKNKEARGA
jgi:hypothetical protein